MRINEAKAGVLRKYLFNAIYAERSDICTSTYGNRAVQRFLF